MKKIFALTLSLIVLPLLSMAAPVKYDISGTLPESCNGKVIKLSYYEARSINNVDSAVVKDGKFSLKGDAEKLVIGRLYVTDVALHLSASVVIGDDGAITASVVDGKLVTTGGKRTALFGELSDKKSAAKAISEDEKMALIEEHRDSTTTEARKKEITAKINIEYAKLQNIEKDFIKAHCDNIVGAYYFNMNYVAFDQDELADLLAKASDEFKSEPTTAKLLKIIEAAKRRQPGVKFTDFTMADRDGKMHKLSEYIKPGHYLLVDFWASWCGPCRAEMPNVKADYAKYHDKGFDVIGISLDSKKDAWLKAIEQLQLPWDHLSDLKGWDCEASKLYGVSGIPCTMLIGSDGIIVANDLRDEELGKKLDELLK